MWASSFANKTFSLVQGYLPHAYLGSRMLSHIFKVHNPYPHERGPMGGTPYIGQRLGGEPVSVLHLDVKECPGKLPTLSSYLPLAHAPKGTVVVLCVRL